MSCANVGEAWNSSIMIGTEPTWTQTTLVPTDQKTSQLCSSCQTLLVRPDCRPETQKGHISGSPEWVVYKGLTDTHDAAKQGSPICKLVMATQETIHQHSTTEDRLCGFKLASFGPSRNLYSGELRYCPLMTWAGIYLRIQVSTLSSSSNLGHVPHDQFTPSHTGSEQCRSVATHWLNHCLTQHPECRARDPSSIKFPSRVIDVGVPGTSQQPRLFLKSEIKTLSHASYITLSHRWASAHVAKLTSASLESLRQCLPMSSLSRTFLDAIIVAQCFGVRYLWIDSLCIIQDSIADWQAESTEMSNIYQNGICNIAATGSAHNGQGLFRDRDIAWVQPTTVQVRYTSHDSNYSISLYDPWGKWVSRSTLNRRGWVLQERSLSPRTVHFASQLFWECRGHQACESYPDGMPNNDELYGDQYEEDDGSALPISLKNWYEDGSSEHFWDKVTEMYGRCRITMPEDRLIAIAGFAKSVQPILGDEYLAGLWKNDLPYNLTWCLLNEAGKLQVANPYRCPSWSWASLDFTSATIDDITISSDRRIETLVNIVEAKVSPLGSDVFGPLRGSHIHLMGCIGRSFKLADWKHEGEWIDGHWSFQAYPDFETTTLDDDSLYCLPLFTRSQNPGPEWPVHADCLLVQRLLATPGDHIAGSTRRDVRNSPWSGEVDRFECTRVGVLNVSLNLANTLPPSLKWIAEFANTKPALRNLGHVFLY